MRGIVFTGEKAEVTDGLEVRAPGPLEVKVRMVAAGVCHSDVSVIDGTIPWPNPAVLGHEGAGIVAEVGAEVKDVKPGDHVVCTTLANCGMCTHCSAGHPTWCRRSMGNMDKPFTLNGQPAWNFAASSYFAEYTVVSAIQVVKIPDDVPLTSACLIGCGVVTGVGAVLNRAMVAYGETAVVFGVGGVGLNVIQALRIARASRIIAIDTVPSKEALARQFGATDFIDASHRDTDVVGAVRDLLPFSDMKKVGTMNAGGVNWAFDCVGHPALIRQGLEMLDWGGNVVIIGVPPPTTEVQLPVWLFNHVDRGVMGCRYGSIRPHHDIPVLVDLYRSGQLMLDELVSATYPLEEFHTVVDDMHEGRLARGVLTF
jgi:S-(hydroxymethyl)glutathione dehydrogenase/alcohol dehydrogenase